MLNMITEQTYTSLGSFNMLAHTVFQIYKHDYVFPAFYVKAKEIILWLLNKQI